MASTIKVNNIQNQCGANIVNKCSTTITLGASGDTIQLACGASQTGFGRTGTVNWDTTAKTASFTAVSGNGYFVNTTSGAITVTLPASPSAGDIVSLSDYTNTWQTNNVTVGRNSSPIGGIAADAILSTEGQSVTFVYVDGTEGWKNVQDSTSNVTGNPFIQATGGTITTCGNCKIHTFTSPGTFCVTAVHPCSANNVLSYMIVAGGGGGGENRGGGGGAGGFREYKSPVTCYTASPLNGNPGGTSITATATAYPITVGAGGAGQTSPCGSGAQGSNSVFSTVTSTGGGGGRDDDTPKPGHPATNGGSGGGSGGGANPGVNIGGSGNTPPVSPSQGFPGGNSEVTGPAPLGNAGGGGGGATQAGFSINSPSNLSEGGAGATTSISGTPTAYAGGGGAGSTGPNTGRVGGAGGGGQGGGPGTSSPGVPGNAGTTNTGGGGGGGTGGAGNPGCGGAGGSGIVIIRYKYQ